MPVFRHIPVLLDEAIVAFGEPLPRVMLDCTVGGGGHAEALLQRGAGEQLYVGLDRDPAALAAAKERLAPFGDRVVLLERAFSEAPEVLAALGLAGVDGLLADLGTSSPQLDVAERGFGFGAKGPLDMRMGREGETAAELIDRVSEAELVSILRQYGEMPGARSLSKRIIEARREGRLETTTQLAELIHRYAPPQLRKRSVHPATLVFQALRIAVNDELGQLEALLEVLPDLLLPGGRAVFIAFHSLEDRKVKHRFRELCTGQGARGPFEGIEEVAADFEPIARKAVIASGAESALNPRARSAKLRAIRRRTIEEAR